MCDHPPRIELLSSSDQYPIWALQVKGVLTLKDLYSAVEDPAPAIGDAEKDKSTGQTISSSAQAAIVDKKAAAIIRQYLSTDVLLGFLDETLTAREIWQELKHTYQSTSLAARMALEDELSTLQMRTGESLQQYYGRTVCLWQRVNNSGMNYKEEHLASRFLSGLPKTYSTARQTIIVSDNGNPLKLRPLLEKLLPIEAELKRYSKPLADDRAMLAKPWQKGEAGNDKPDGDKPKGKFCRYCKKPGHQVEECRKLAYKLNKEKEDGEKEPDAFEAYETYAMSATASVEYVTPTTGDLSCSSIEDHEWVGDSGSSRHLTHDIGNLKNVRPVPHQIKFTFANGHQSDAACMGDCDILLYGKTGKRAVLIELNDVCYVPGAAANLVSLGRASRPGLGNKFVFQDGHCDIYYQDNHTAHIPTRNNIPVIGSTYEPEENTALLAKRMETPQLWHVRLGHPSYGNLARAVNMVKGMHISSSSCLEAAKAGPCDICMQGKQHRQPFTAAESSCTTPMERLHMDVYGPLPESRGANKYFVSFVDGHSKYGTLVCIARKSDVVTVVPGEIAKLERMSGHKLKAIRAYNGGEFLKNELQDFFTTQGVKIENTVPYSPQMNGLAERFNRTINEKMCALLQQAGLGEEHWADAANTACLLRNVTPVTGLSVTPYEAFTGRTPDLSHLRVFGSKAYVHVPKHQRPNKLASKSVEGIMIGYAANTKAYRILKADGTITVSRDVVFHETLPPLSVPVPCAAVEPLPAPADPATAAPPSNVSGNGASPSPAADPPSSTSSGEDSASDSGSEQEGAPAPAAPTKRYPTRARMPSNRYPTQEYAQHVHADGITTPLTLEQALASPERQFWKQAINDELDSLGAHNTWDLTELPKGHKAIPVKWVFDVKRDVTGKVARFKARLVAKGFLQTQGIDFTEVFAPVSRHPSLRVLLAVAAAHNLDIHHLDIKTAFLNGELEEEVYVTQPPGYPIGPPNMVCKLNKALYGLKQAPRAWHTKLDATLQGMGLTPSKADAGLYINKSEEGLLLMLVWVDDLVTAAITAKVQSIKKQVLSTFDGRDLGEVSHFLGMGIYRDRPARIIRLNQRQAILDLVAKFGMSDAKPRNTPLAPGARLCEDEGDELDTTKHPYGSLVGSLNYIATCTRPDISYSVGLLARYLTNPTEAHWQGAKSVLQYLNSTAGYSLTYNGKLASEPLGYCDADYAGDTDTRRSTSGAVFTMCGGAVVWYSKRQQSVSVSTCEAEYIGASMAVKDALWLRQVLADTHLFEQLGPIRVRGDNQSSLKLIRNPITSARSKHIDIAHHFVRERAALGHITFSYIPTAEMVADVLTKALPAEKHKFCCAGMGVG